MCKAFLEGILKTIHLLLTLSILSIPLLSFAADETLPSTVQTINGCDDDDEKLKTTEGQRDCFQALGKVESEIRGLEGDLSKIDADVAKLAREKQAATEIVNGLTGKKARSLSDLPEVNQSKQTAIKTALTRMEAKLNSEEARKISSTMEKLFKKSNLNQLTHEELTKLVDDKDVKDALGCGVLINDRDCNSWEVLKKDIDKNYKALLVEAKSNVDATEQKYLEKRQELDKKTKDKVALEEIQRSDKTGPFFDKLNDLGMLSKLALMNAEQLKGHLDLGEAQLEVLKQKLGNSILGIVMNEKIDKKLEEQAAAIDQQIAAKTDILEAQIEHLRGNFCREATANPICSPLEAAIADGEEDKSAISGTSAAPAPAPAPAPADTATQE